MRHTLPTTCWMVCLLGAFCLGCGDSGDDGKGASGGSGAAAGSGGSTGGSGGTGGGTGGSAGSTGGAAGSAMGGSAGQGGSLPGFPDGSNTGIPDGACPNGLTPATDEQINPESNAVVECVLFDAGLPYVQQEDSNITYRHCRFETDSGDAFVNLQGGPVTFDECEFEGGAGTWIRASYEAHDLVVRRCDFSGMANAVEFGTNNVLIEENYVHDFGNVEQDQHADGFQTEGADGFNIIHNSILMQADVWGSTSALLVSGDNSSAKNNLVAGAGYTVHFAGDIEVTGNRFSTMFYDTCGFYGPVYPEALAPTGVWSDNLWHDGPNAGQALDAP